MTVGCGSMARDFFTISDRILEAVEWLKSDFELKARSSSPLEYTLRLIDEERERCRQLGVPATGLQTLAQARTICGLELLCDRLLRAHEFPGIPAQFGRWIRQLGVGAPSLCACYVDYPDDAFPTEESKRGPIRQASTDMLELVVGLAALELGTSVTLEDRGDRPDLGKPDVCVDIGDTTWGFGCKVSDTDNPKTHFRIVRDAARKAITHLNNGFADCALTVLCVQNAISRQPIILPNFAAAKLSLKRRVAEFSENVQRVVAAENRDALVLSSDSRVVPGVVVYFEDVYLIGSATSDYVLPSGTNSIGNLNYAPIGYAQYVTYGENGLELTGVPEWLAIALTGPDTGKIDDVRVGG